MYTWMSAAVFVVYRKDFDIFAFVVLGFDFSSKINIKFCFEMIWFVVFVLRALLLIS